MEETTEAEALEALQQAAKALRNGQAARLPYPELQELRRAENRARHRWLALVQPNPQPQPGWIDFMFWASEPAL